MFHNERTNKLNIPLFRLYTSSKCNRIIHVPVDSKEQINPIALTCIMCNAFKDYLFKFKLPCIYIYKIGRWNSEMLKVLTRRLFLVWITFILSRVILIQRNTFLKKEHKTILYLCMELDSLESVTIIQYVI